MLPTIAQREHHRGYIGRPTPRRVACCEFTYRPQHIKCVKMVSDASSLDAQQCGWGSKTRGLLDKTLNRSPLYVFIPITLKKKIYHIMFICIRLGFFFHASFIAIISIQCYRPEYRLSFLNSKWQIFTKPNKMLTISFKSIIHSVSSVSKQKCSWWVRDRTIGTLSNNNYLFFIKCSTQCCFDDLLLFIPGILMVIQ